MHNRMPCSISDGTQLDDEPAVDVCEDLEYEAVRQEQIDDLAAVLRDIGTIRFIDLKVVQAN